MNPQEQQQVAIAVLNLLEKQAQQTAQLSATIVERMGRVEDAVFRQGGTTPDVEVEARAHKPVTIEIRQMGMGGGGGVRADEINLTSESAGTRGKNIQNGTGTLILTSLENVATGQPSLDGIEITLYMEGSYGTGFTPLGSTTVQLQGGLAVTGGAVAFPAIRVSDSLALDIRLRLHIKTLGQDRLRVSGKLTGYLAAGSR